MTRKLQLLRGTTAKVSAYTGADGELMVDTQTHEVRVNDGVTAGGHKLAMANLSNISDNAKNIANWSSNVSNCVTKIPQDIKLELNAGTLTLKAGSKVYVPNSSGVFTSVTTDNDLTITSTGASDVTFFVYGIFNGSKITSLVSYIDSSSGTDWTATSQYQCRYNTADNMIKNTNDTGSTWVNQLSFPIVIASRKNGAISSIDQVFNGVGYIGSTAFTLPGLSYLISNYHNTDDTLKSISVTLTQCHINTFTYSAGSYYISGDASGTPLFTGKTVTKYDADRNVVVDTYTGADRAWCFIASCNTDSNRRITSLSTKTAFHAVDYNDTDFIAHQSAPSSRSIDLTLPATGGYLTAPADGYFSINKATNAAGQYFTLINNTNYAQCIAYPNTGGFNCRVMLFVGSGDRVQCNYTAGGATNFCKFIYANGAK